MGLCFSSKAVKLDSYLPVVIVMVISHGQTSNEFQFVRRRVLLAVVAVQFEVALGVLDDLELGRHVVLLVGHAVGVEALHDALDAVGDADCLLADDLKLLDLDDGGSGGHECDLVEVGRGEVFV